MDSKYNNSNGKSDYHNINNADSMNNAGSVNNIIQKDEQVQLLMRPLYALLEPSSITELTINQPYQAWTKNRDGWQLHKVPQLSSDYLQSLATAIIVFNGMQAKSIVSVVLPNGERGQIVMPPACIDGTLSISIRKHSLIVKTLEELDGEGAFTKYRDVSFNKPSFDNNEDKEKIDALLYKQDFTRLEQFELVLLKLKAAGNIKEFLEQAVLNKCNIIIAGKTGSGKTTFARSLIRKVPTEERIITIEDVHELILAEHPNKVHMLYGDGAGRVSANDCLKSCMRQSPDRIFLAELRGDESWEYLNSLNTGHPGSITTTHANNCLQTFERVATLVKNSETGMQLDTDMIKTVLYTTIDIVLFVRKFKVVEIFYDPIFAKTRLK